MQRVAASSHQAEQALALVESLQVRFVQALENLGGEKFRHAEWFRDDGRHGGGERYGVEDTALLGRASVNVAQVHYDDAPERNLASASALSAIVHPAHPRMPSVHIHISWTERKDGAGYWRIMADLNSSIPNESDTACFSDALRQAAPTQFDEAVAQGDRYFFIPVLGRHRGVMHFYLENYSSGDFAEDLALARSAGEAAIDTYVQILEKTTGHLQDPAEEEATAQLAYHTLYFFQVLTLDRGTTMGLLVHDQNDVGILGSLPPRIEKNLLASWRSRMPEPQDLLLADLLAVLPRSGICEIDESIKQKLAAAVRAHYLKYPQALELQASGNSTPPTIENHQ